MVENEIESGSTAGQIRAESADAHGQAPRTQKIGQVVSDKMDKTVVVTVDSVRSHPLYRKRITRTSRFMAHDAENQCKPGDTVRIEETRPMSKRKRWIVREVLERGVQV